MENLARIPRLHVRVFQADIIRDVQSMLRQVYSFPWLLLHVAGSDTAHVFRVKAPGGSSKETLRVLRVLSREDAQQQV